MEQELKIVGLDPGQLGSVALLDGTQVVSVLDLPIVDKELDTSALFSLILEWEPDLLVTEDTFNRKSLVRFVGEVVAICKIQQIDYIVTAIISWKTRILGRNTKDKKVSIAKCLELFPTADIYNLKGKANDNKAEAILLAEYGRRLRT